MSNARTKRLLKAKQNDVVHPNLIPHVLTSRDIARILASAGLKRLKREDTPHRLQQLARWYALVATEQAIPRKQIGRAHQQLASAFGRLVHQLRLTGLDGDNALKVRCGYNLFGQYVWNSSLYRSWDRDRTLPSDPADLLRADLRAAQRLNHAMQAAHDLHCHNLGWGPVAYAFKLRSTTADVAAQIFIRKFAEVYRDEFGARLRITKGTRRGDSAAGGPGAWALRCAARAMAERLSTICPTHSLARLSQADVGALEAQVRRALKGATNAA